MIKKNVYSRITESIVKSFHDTNLDSAMEDGQEMQNMGKKIVAIITADPDQDLDWESEYEPFGREELTSDDEAECCEHEGIEHDTCPSCGYDVDCEDDEDDDMEDIMIGGGFESEDDSDEDLEDADVKDILIDILDELRGEDSEEEDTFEPDEENPMFGSSSDEDDSDDEEEDDDDEDDESKMMPSDDWSSEYEDEDSDEEDDDSEYEEEDEQYEAFQEDEDEDILCAPQEQEEDEVIVFDALDNA